MTQESARTVELSFVVPCFNEEANIVTLYEEVLRVSGDCVAGGWEVIFVDDGSTDGTLDALRSVAGRDGRARYISFSRNFGKEAAMLAGLQAANGERVVMLDADLQHPPSMIPKMMEEMTVGGYDCLAAKRTRKGDPVFRSFAAKSFYRIVSRLANVDMVDGVGDFRLMTRKYVDAVLRLDERNRFSKGIYPWIGFNTKHIEYENVKRAAGETKWPLLKLIGYSINGVTGFSTGLLSMVSLTGIVSFLTSVVMLILLVIRKLVGNVPVDGWTTIVCMIVLFGGLILLAIGVLGQYIEKIYTEIKRRPHYIVKESRV